MFPILSVAQAQQTILKRFPIDEVTVPPSLTKGLEATFGEPVSPAEAVRRILRDIRGRGEPALREWTLRLDGLDIPSPIVPLEEAQAALNALDPDLRQALQESADRIRTFYEKQPCISWMDQSMGGTLGQLIRPMQRVGVYVPGGTAPLPSTVLMSAIPARVAGVKEVVIITPPANPNGKPNQVLLAAAAIAGVDAIYLAGGAQAIAALAYGTDSIPPVDKIVGPGNLFVTLAKQQVFGTVGIDGLAGPTETVVIADSSANPSWAAADLLAQAEHDVLASAILLTPSRTFAEQVQQEISAWMEGKDQVHLTRSEIIFRSLASRSGAVITADIPQAISLSNAYGPEHLNLAITDPWKYLDQVTCAGGVFLGETSCEVMGDYIAGPSHVMPTGGTARFSSPLNVWDFVHLISLIGLDSDTAARLGVQADRIAQAEGLDAHALAGRLRAARG